MRKLVVMLSSKLRGSVELAAILAGALILVVTGGCGPSECAGGRCAGADGGTPEAPEPDARVAPEIPDTCGNQSCDLDESCGSCQADCGACGAGLVLLWTFDDISEARADDASGRGYDGEIVGAVSAGSALKFSGDDYVLLTQAPDDLKPTDEVAVSASIRASETDTVGGEVVNMGDSYGLRVLGNGKVRFFVWHENPGYAYVDTPNLSVLDGERHDLVGQYDGTSLEIYVDGLLAASLDVTGPIQYTLGVDLNVGRHGYGLENLDFIGHIDGVRVYSRALNKTEIEALRSF